MTELITTFGIGNIIIILLIAIPSLVGFITWCKTIWAKREQFKQDNINKGRQIEQRAEAEEHRLESGESRIAKLELLCGQMAETIEELRKSNDRLMRSDLLTIKTWIKQQHDIWMRKGCIDSQTLELLEQRFEIYQEEGGNSWAEKLMNELRSLPVAIIVPIDEIHEDK